MIIMLFLLPCTHTVDYRQSAIHRVQSLCAGDICNRVLWLAGSIIGCSKPADGVAVHGGHHCQS